MQINDKQTKKSKKKTHTHITDIDKSGKKQTHLDEVTFLDQCSLVPKQNEWIFHERMNDFELLTAQFIEQCSVSVVHYSLSVVHCVQCVHNAVHPWQRHTNG